MRDRARGRDHGELLSDADHAVEVRLEVMVGKIVPVCAGGPSFRPVESASGVHVGVAGYGAA